MSGEEPDNPPSGKSGGASPSKKARGASKPEDKLGSRSRIQSGPEQFESVHGSVDSQAFRKTTVDQLSPVNWPQGGGAQEGHVYGDRSLHGSSSGDAYANQAPEQTSATIWQQRTQEGGRPHPGAMHGHVQSTMNDVTPHSHTRPMMRPDTGHWAGATQTMPAPEESTEPKNLVAKVQFFFKKHGDKMWWLHSLWAMGWGTFIVIYAQKGFQYARWLMLALFAAWFVLLLSFRAAEVKPEAVVDERKEKVKELVINYVLKNLYQIMLFFLLPWYYKSATLGRENMYFVIVLALCTVLATLDIVFDRFLMRVRIFASIYYTIALFSCLNLAIPAFAPLSPTPCLLLAAGISVAVVWSLHSPLSSMKSKRDFGIFAAVVLFAVGSAWSARRFIPPVPLSIASGAVGPELLDDGRLKMKVTVLHYSMVEKMIGVTDLTAPSNTPSDMKHVWLQDGRLVARTDPEVTEVSEGLLRVQSTLPTDKMPDDKTGAWHLQVETSAGQLVGEIEFEVIE